MSEQRSEPSIQSLQARIAELERELDKVRPYRPDGYDVFKPVSSSLLSKGEEKQGLSSAREPSLTASGDEVANHEAPGSNGQGGEG